MEQTPKTGLSIIEIKKIITPYRFYYEIEHRDFEEGSRVFGKVKYLKHKYPSTVVLESLNLQELEESRRGTHIIKLTEELIPRFEEATWRKTHSYEEV